MQCPFEKASRSILLRLSNAIVDVGNKTARVLIQNATETEELRSGGFVESPDMELKGLSSEFTGVKAKDQLQVQLDSGDTLFATVKRPPKPDGAGLTIIQLTPVKGNSDATTNPVIRY